MGRRRNTDLRGVRRDPTYHNQLIEMIGNRVVKNGKKALAYRIVYTAIENLKDKTVSAVRKFITQTIDKLKAKNTTAQDAKAAQKAQTTQTSPTTQTAQNSPTVQTSTAQTVQKTPTAQTVQKPQGTEQTQNIPKVQPVSSVKTPPAAKKVPSPKISPDRAKKQRSGTTKTPLKETPASGETKLKTKRSRTDKPKRPRVDKDTVKKRRSNKAKSRSDKDKKPRTDKARKPRTDKAKKPRSDKVKKARSKRTRLDTEKEPRSEKVKKSRSKKAPSDKVKKRRSKKTRPDKAKKPRSRTTKGRTSKATKAARAEARKKRPSKTRKRRRLKSDETYSVKLAKRVRPKPYVSASKPISQKESAKIAKQQRATMRLKRRLRMLNKGSYPINRAIFNVRPKLEVKPRRRGTGLFQVPYTVNVTRGVVLAIKWVLQAARKKTGKSMIQLLTAELLDAFYKKGTAVKRRDESHRMAEANKAFTYMRYNNRR